MAAPPGVTPWLQRKPLRPPTRRIVYGEAVSVTRVSGIHYRGPTIRRVSCYALLRRCQLPWPHSRCLHRETLFGGSMSEYLATLTTCTVDPALPDLLTRLGPLAIGIQSTGGHYDIPRRVVHLGSMFGVVGEESPSVPRTVSLRHIALHCREGSYPVGHFGGNQLLGGSMSLSPLCCILTSNLHVSNATGLH